MLSSPSSNGPSAPASSCTKRNTADHNSNDTDDTIMKQTISCWKCFGKGRKYQKDTHDYDGGVCGVCGGTGHRAASKKSKNLSEQPGVVVELRGYPDGRPFQGVPAVTSKDVPQRGELLASLGCGDWRIFQLAGGHKLTVDDFVCAYVAAKEMKQRKNINRAFGATPDFAGEASSSSFSHADIGCGCGSVLMTLAWAFPGSIRSYGVEAQAVSYRLCRRGLLWNLGQDGSKEDHLVRVSHDDLRTWNGENQKYDLITGTPPYFPLARFVSSENHSQKIRCRVPTRGAASDYIEAAARLLADDGVLVLVETAQKEGELAIWEALKKYQLRATKRIDVVTRAGLPPRFSCWVMVRQGKNGDDDNKNSTEKIAYEITSTFTLRNDDTGKSRTLEYVQAMEELGWIDFENTVYS